MFTMAGTFTITRNPRSSFAGIDPFLALRAIRRGNLRDQCDALSTTQEKFAFSVFEWTFTEFVRRNELLPM
jgi:hypothetical protein